jgi:hypothetical protein
LLPESLQRVLIYACSLLCVGGDERFRLDERFVPSDEEDESTLDQSSMARSEWLNRKLQKERSKSLGVDNGVYTDLAHPDSDSNEAESGGETPMNL